jgi:hypothetical protein
MRFKCYVVANDREEYLYSISTHQYGVVRAWTLLPELAMFFKSKNKALKNAVNGSFVCELYETQTQYIVKFDR